MFETFDHNAQALVAKRRRLLRLPYPAHGILSASFTFLTSTSSSRSWALPPTFITDEVTHYSSRHTILGLKGPLPRLRNSVTPSLAEELASRLDVALQFAELGTHADPLIKPILLYYACVQLCGVYTRAFFDWDFDKRTHGLTCSLQPGDLPGTQLIVQNSGQFQRLATTCFLLSGQPSCFSPLVTYSTSPTAHTKPGEFLESFGRTDQGAPVARITLDELVHFDYDKRLKAVKRRHGFHKFKGLPSTAFLVDVMTLFLGSYLARYDVLGWRHILKGTDNAYRVHFDECFDRFLAFTIDALLASLESPLSDFDISLRPSHPSPYSARDRSRFSEDPNIG